MEIELENKIDIIPANTIEVVYTNELDVVPIDSSDIELTIAKREFVVTGDNIYIPTYYDDAPQWLKDLVDVVLDVAIDSRDQDVLNRVQSVLDTLDYVPMNQYTEQILQLTTEDSILNGKIETLDSTFNTGLSQSNAKIANIEQTYVTADSASAIALSVLNSSVSDSSTILGSTVASIQESYTDLTGTMASNYDVLTSTLEDLDTGVVGNASAVQYLNTYVGISDTGGLTGTGLLANVSILQKQNDGVIETYTGTYDVITDSNADGDSSVLSPDDIGLDKTAIPYVNWTPIEAPGAPLYAGELDGRVQYDTANEKYYKVVDGAWEEVTYEVYLASREYLRSLHVGDVYIKYSNSDGGYKNYERAYKFIKTVKDETSPYATDTDGYSWAVITDTDAQNAYVAALNAYDLADDKRRVFVGLGATTTPSVPYDQGDLWLIDAERTVNGYACQIGDILRCVEDKGNIATYEQNDWVLASSYTNAVKAQQEAFQDWVDGDYSDELLVIHGQIDKKAESYYQETMPHAEGTNSEYSVWVGDLWKKPSDNTEYIYQLVGSIYKWVLTDVPDIVYDTIDGKKTIFTGNTVPTPIGIDDMWITGDSPVSPYEAKSIYVWNGSAWIIPVKYTDDTLIEGFLIDGNTKLDLTKAYVDGSTSFTQYVADEIDKEVVVYSGSDHTAQIGMKLNDIYIEKTTVTASSGIVVDVTNTYKYNGTAWIAIGNNDNITALADLADGKRTVFSGNTVPVGAVARDIWIPSATNGSYLKGEIYQYSGSAWIVATKYSADLEAVRSNLQSQVDGKVETYYQATVPTGMTSVNNGDYWYCTANVSTYKKGKMYKYVHATTSWVETADVSRYAFDIADGKAAIFSSTSAPTTGYKINDMLIVIGSFNNGTTTFSDGVVLSSNANRVSGFIASDWVKKINDTEDLDAFVSGTYTPTVTSLQNQVDGQISYYFFDSSLGQSAASVSGSVSWNTDTLKRDHNGDIAYDTKLEVGSWYDRTTASWVQITGAQNAGVIEALKRAAAAKEAADSVVVSYYAWKQTTAPATKYKWMKDDNTLWEYVGSSWVAVDVKKDDTLTAYNNTTKDTTLYVHNGSNWAMITPNGIVANAKAVTDLKANLNSLGTTVSGHTSLLNTVDARIGTEGARVESKFGYNSSLVLNGTTYNSGFGLATSLTANSGLTTGQSEFWIKADKFKLMSASGTKKSSYSPFSVDSTTGDITFNGKVSFTNTTGVPDFSLKEKVMDDFESYTSNAEMQTKWDLVSGSALPFRSTVKASGVYAMGVGSATANQAVSWLEYGDFFPVNTSDLYRIRGKVRRDTTATGTCYLGIVCYAANKVTKLNTAGTNTYTSQHYIAASSVTLTTGYVEYIGYFKGQATSGNGGQHNSALDPATVYSGTAFVRGLFVANYGTDTIGYMYLDDFVIEKVDSNYVGTIANATLNSANSYTNTMQTTVNNYTDTIAQALIDNEITDAENSAIIKALDLAPVYSTNYGIITYDQTKGMIKLYSTDISIGMTYRAQACDSKTAYTISIQAMASAAYSTGFHFGVCEYDSELPSGKTHIGTSGAAVVQTPTRSSWLGVNNGAITTSLSTYKFDYTPTSTAKYFSVVILNYSGMSTASLWCKPVSVANKVSTSLSTNNDAFARAQGFTSYAAMQTAYSSLGKTIISGGYINTGLVKASSILANSVSADRLIAGTSASTVWTGGGLVSANFNGNPYGSIGSPTAGFRLSSNASGTSTDPNIYGAYIKGAVISGSTVYADNIVGDTIRVDYKDLPRTFIGEGTFTTGAYYKVATVAVASTTFSRQVIFENLKFEASNCAFQYRLQDNSGNILFESVLNSVDGVWYESPGCTVAGSITTIHLYVKRTENTGFNSLYMSGTPLKVTMCRVDSTALDITYVYGA